eukprot:CAMPEP_0205827466 /NCGR_PEP_ID=MMETSP0206-20130828/32113_1 /ASSEMBLY_ACC=CAM_ASM_000279 /TAXON_ID=36767 /ORGANISM="Euplotes focardii, Strain TN1" /LENGTH=56 /DNA_ID=CAMNT_0053128403 /DNA_START=175 /DNA_END=342 /DNA_ORIENTATION=-
MNISTNSLEPTTATSNLDHFEEDIEVQKLQEELMKMEEEEKWLDDTILNVENQLSE